MIYFLNTENLRLSLGKNASVQSEFLRANNKRHNNNKYSNYQQRNYSEEFLENLYANL